MANQTVEKLKTLGLKHGEKAAVGIAVALFLLFVVMAVSKESIKMTPEELAERARSADSNLSKPQRAEDILEQIEKVGVKPSTDFEQVVDKTLAKSLNPEDYVVKNKWVTPEPGAGLIRDQPELIAVEELYAFPNRGGYLVYELDPSGERIVDDGKTARPRRSRAGRRRSMMGMMGGPSMMAMMMGGGGGANMTPKQKEAAEARRKQEQERLSKSFAGSERVVDKPDEKKTSDTLSATVNYKETVKGLRSVVITGVLDHKRLKENYLAALKDKAIANPNYQRPDVERQMLLPSGKWTAFATVDAEANMRILDNLPEVDEELVPEAPGPRLEELVDPLPFPKAGYWEGVHLANLVPKSKREIAAPAESGLAGMGGMGGMMNMNEMMKSQMGGMGGGNMEGMMAKMGGGNTMAKMMAAMGGGMGGSAGSTGPADETDFQKSDADEVMVRSIDFTVQPDATYRYRIRLVVINPNYLRNDVSPGTDTDSLVLKGPWSEPSPEVTVPPDIAPYAMLKSPPGRRRDRVSFQILRWNPEDGHTVVRTDEAGPGELVGTPASTEIPSSEGKGKKSQLVDFNSHRFVLDEMGGNQPMPPPFKSIAPSFEVPAVSLLVRPDGAVAVHSQAHDASDEFRSKMVAGYRQELQDSTKRREPMGMMGMMGMGMGMMGGGR